MEIQWQLICYVKYKGSRENRYWNAEVKNYLGRLYADFSQKEYHSTLPNEMVAGLESKQIELGIQVSVPHEMSSAISIQWWFQFHSTEIPETWNKYRVAK